LQLIAFLVLVRTVYMCQDLQWGSERMIFYERALQDPDGYLPSLLRLSPFNFSQYAEQDFNIIGEAFRGSSYGWQTLQPAERDEIEAILAPLCWQLGYQKDVGSFKRCI
jgi:hypothetical protein